MQIDYYRINYFNIYSLDFTYCRTFFDAIAEKNDPISNELNEALNVEGWRKDSDRRIQLNELFKDILKKGPNDSAENLIQECNDLNNYIIGLLKQTDGANPFKIQAIVHQILGISAKNEGIDPPLRQKYFELMKNSGFLCSDYTAVNTPDQKNNILHHPGELALQYLKTHEEVKTLIIGCGEQRKTYVSYCTAISHNEPALQIDISAQMGPDIVTDMHNPDFWEMLPDEHFENIYDHSNGRFIFDNELSTMTLQQIFKTLKSGGQYSTIYSLTDGDKLKLVEAGFIVEGNTAIKPL